MGRQIEDSFLPGVYLTRLNDVGNEIDSCRYVLQLTGCRKRHRQLGKKLNTILEMYMYVRGEVTVLLMLIVTRSADADITLNLY